jgi:hypothetical protein
MNDREDEMNEEEQDEAGMSPNEDRPNASDWVNAAVEADAKAEKERMRAEKYEHRRPTAKEWIEDWEEDQQDAKKKTLYISTLLRQLKIYSTE